MLDDLYDDLETFDYGEKISELEAKNNILEEDLKKLKANYDKIVEENNELQKKNEILETNISSLYKTATTELSRKDRNITELRTQLDNVIFQKSQRQNYRNANGSSSHNSGRSDQNVQGNISNCNLNEDNRENIINVKQQREENHNLDYDKHKSQSANIDKEKNSIHQQKMTQFTDNKVNEKMRSEEEIRYRYNAAEYNKKNSYSISEKLYEKNVSEKESHDSPLRHKNRRSPNRFNRDRRHVNDSYSRKRSRSRESRNCDASRNRMRSRSRERSRMHKESYTSTIHSSRNNH